MPVSERPYMRDPSWMYDEHEFGEPDRQRVGRPSIAWTVWQVVVLVFLGAVILGLLASLLK